MPLYHKLKRKNQEVNPKGQRKMENNILSHEKMGQTKVKRKVISQVQRLPIKTI